MEFYLKNHINCIDIAVMMLYLVIFLQILPMFLLRLSYIAPSNRPRLSSMFLHETLIIVNNFHHITKDLISVTSIISAKPCIASLALKACN